VTAAPRLAVGPDPGATATGYARDRLSAAMVGVPLEAFRRCHGSPRVNRLPASIADRARVYAAMRERDPNGLRCSYPEIAAAVREVFGVPCGHSTVIGALQDAGLFVREQPLRAAGGTRGRRKKKGRAAA
jgi:hypothetical protein